MRGILELIIYKCHKDISDLPEVSFLPITLKNFNEHKSICQSFQNILFHLKFMFINTAINIEIMDLFQLSWKDSKTVTNINKFWFKKFQDLLLSKQLRYK